MHSKIISGLLILLINLLGFVGIFAQKMAAEEIIAKHLTSFGKNDIVENSKKRMAIGSSEFVMRSSAKKSVGRAVLASDGDNMAFFSTFEMRDYPMERIGIFDNKINIPTVDLNRRSPLGSFLAIYDKVLNDHIFGGSIFSTWLFLDTAIQKGRIETESKKKINGREAWVVKYTPKGGLGSDSYVKLYFDAENFQHLRTVYRQKETERGFYDTGSKAANQGQVPGAWDQNMAANGSTLTEDFGDIREVEGLTLPYKYAILLSIDSVSGTSEFKWSFELSEYRTLKEFPADFFSFKANIQK